MSFAGPYWLGIYRLGGQQQRHPAIGRCICISSQGWLDIGGRCDNGGKQSADGDRVQWVFAIVM